MIFNKKKYYLSLLLGFEIISSNIFSLYPYINQILELIKNLKIIQYELLKWYSLTNPLIFYLIIQLNNEILDFKILKNYIFLLLLEYEYIYFLITKKNKEIKQKKFNEKLINAFLIKINSINSILFSKLNYFNSLQYLNTLEVYNYTLKNVIFFFT